MKKGGRGRPSRQFQRSMGLLYKLLQEDPSSKVMTDRLLASKICVSASSIKSYIHRLKADGKISTVTSRIRCGGSWVNRRTINILG